MKNYLIILISVLALSLNAQVTKKMNGNYEFLGNTTFDSYIYIAPPPTPAASFLFLQSALTGAVEQAMSIQVIDGLAPYVEIKTPAKTTGTATTTLTLNPDTTVLYSQLEVTKEASFTSKIYSQNINTIPTLELQGYHSSGYGRIRLSSTRSTYATPLSVLSGYTLGKIEFGGSGSSSNITQSYAGLYGEATEAWSGSAAGSKIVFFTCDNTTKVADDRVIIDQDGTFETLYNNKYAYEDIAVTTTLSNANKHYIYVDATSGDVIISLPDATTYINYEWIIKRIDASANTVTIDLDEATDSIDGVVNGSFTLNSMDSYTLHAVTDNWYKH